MILSHQSLNNFDVVIILLRIKTAYACNLVRSFQSFFHSSVRSLSVRSFSVRSFSVRSFFLCSLALARSTLRNGSGFKPNQSGWFGCGSGSGLVFQDLETTLEPNQSVRFESVWTRKNLYIYRMFLYIECFYV